MVKLIAFTGPQGTGKTTMKEYLVNVLIGKGYKVMNGYHGVSTSISREAAALGFIINKGTSFASQYYMVCRYMMADLATRQVAEKLKMDYIIVDRSVLDTIAYIVLGEMPLEDKQYIEDTIINHFKRFKVDMLIYCEALDNIIGDEHRSDDIEYQKHVDVLMKHCISRNNISDITDLRWLYKGTVSERLVKVIEYMRTRWQV